MDSFQEQLTDLEKYKKKVYKYRLKEADMLLAIGEIYLDEDEPEAALENLQEAKNLYQKIEYPKGEAHAQNLIGDTYLTVRDIPQAIKHYQKAFKIFGFLNSPLKSDLFEKIQEVEKVQEAINIVKEDELGEDELGEDELGE